MAAKGVVSVVQSDERKDMKKIRAFIDYHKKDEGLLGEDVAHLASHFEGLGKEQRKEFAKEWASKCGTKGNLRAFLQQSITQQVQTDRGAISGYLIPSQIAKLLELHVARFDAKALEDILRKEIQSNQDLHKVEESKRHQGDPHSFWNCRFLYKFEKARDETHTSRSQQEMVRTGDMKHGEIGSLAPMLDCGSASSSISDGKEDGKPTAAEIRRGKKAQGLIDVLMKVIQQSRTQVLLQKSKKVEGLKEKVRHLERVEHWAVSAMSILEAEPCNTATLESLQEAVQLYKVELAENWALGPGGKNANGKRDAAGAGVGEAVAVHEGAKHPRVENDAYEAADLQAGGSADGAAVLVEGPPAAPIE